MPIDPQCLERMKATTTALLDSEPHHIGELSKLIHCAEPNPATIHEYIRQKYLDILKRQNSGDLLEWLAQLMAETAMQDSIMPHLKKVLIARLLGKVLKPPTEPGEEWKQGEQGGAPS